MANAISAGSKTLQSGKVISLPQTLKKPAGSTQSEYLLESSTSYSVGKAVIAHDVVEKISEEAEFWLIAQKQEREKEEEERKAREAVRKCWEPPRAGWIKCNIGVDFDKKVSKSGGAWVVRNERGKILMHSRRVFNNVKSLDEAKYKALLWSLESLSFHHLNKVIIALDDDKLTKVILRPKAWPNFKGQYV
ncbi:hypothetical protein F2Q69_00020443 [Brassica cretica]|uniref:RNase H type-1 domain-containing protein n=1 Tax=Brassica cretica TaxID=69181 RepID=A0A8S9Q6L3_BRACR|nr:hypothetical protein F2Q69_00020443 [Brassica cretica]